MAGLETPDYYEVLQVSPNADQDTIQRVFRHLAKRYHPDNPETGDGDRFRQLFDAFQVLSDPEQRVQYDVKHADLKSARWKFLDQESAHDDISVDRRLRAALLSILYIARRNDAEKPGVGDLELERALDCPTEHMRFHIWYLKENGWVQRTEAGKLAITASGVDLVMETGGPSRVGVHLIDSGESNGAVPRNKSA